jgi:hypothetical protein
VFGHQWQSAEGVVVDSRIARFDPVGPGWNELPVHEFIVDVHLPDGEVFRATVEQGKVAAPEVGATVGVRVDSKTRKVIFDDKDPRLNVDAVMRALNERERDRFASEAQQPPETT